HYLFKRTATSNEVTDIELQDTTTTDICLKSFLYFKCPKVFSLKLSISLHKTLNVKMPKNAKAVGKHSYRNWTHVCYRLLTWAKSNTPSGPVRSRGIMGPVFLQFPSD
ncbi:hypothetical protein IscW_ISCW014361, partial [Ixodes scapularis]